MTAVSSSNATESMKKKFEELNMTQDEMRRFSEALKKDEFRKLLCEYAEEIADPKNRELYEREIAQLEQERGKNVTFIHPEPGFCLKTAIDDSTRRKVFVNICQNANVEMPSSERGGAGMHWRIPHTCSPGREDTARAESDELCTVYDVVFHPNAYRMGETNERFRKLLVDSALDTVEANFKLKLDRAHVKTLKSLNFKGRPVATVVRRPVVASHEQETPAKSLESEDPIGEIVDKVKEDTLAQQKLAQQTKLEKKTTYFKKEQETPMMSTLSFTVPKYSIVHRGETDLQDYTIGPSSGHVLSTRPRELCVSIELPLVKSLASANVKLDVFERSLVLSAAPSYKLEIVLPFPVRETEARAKFDKSKRVLLVTVPVRPSVVLQRNDSVSTAGEDQGFVDNHVDDDVDELSSLSSSPGGDNNSATSASPDIRYSLPWHFEARETPDEVRLCVSCDTSVARESVKAQFLDNDELLHITCESMPSDGGYVRYFAAHCRFRSRHFQRDDIELSFPNDEQSFEVVLRKTENEEGAGQVTIALNREQLQQEDSVLVIDIQQQQQQQEEKEKVNRMSKKDYILNFDKIAHRNTTLDEDDDDAGATKLTDAASPQLEQMRFNKKKQKRKNKKKAEAEAVVHETAAGKGNESAEEATVAASRLDSVTTDDDYDATLCDYLLKQQDKANGVADNDDDDEEAQDAVAPIAFDKQMSSSNESNELSASSSTTSSSSLKVSYSSQTN